MIVAKSSTISWMTEDKLSDCAVEQIKSQVHLTGEAGKNSQEIQSPQWRLVPHLEFVP